jgi:two-component system response regulator CpxR
MARILIIDDDVDFCALLQAILEQAGHEIVVAYRGREGITWYDPASIDLGRVDEFIIPG